MVGAARRAAEWRAERAADHDRRRWLRRTVHLRRGDPDADARQAGAGGPALHQLPLHLALLADPGGADHRPQPPCRRLRRRRRDGDRLPRLRLGHPQGDRHDRHDPARQRLRDLLVRQEPQHALLPGEPGRAVRPMAHGHGLRVFLRLHRRRREPVAAEPLPQHHRHLSLRRQPGLEPDHGDGRRGDRLHEADEGDRPRQAVPRLLRPRRNPRAASSDAGVGEEDQRHAPVRRRLEQAARHHVRQPEAARHHARDRPAYRVAEGPAGMGHAQRGREGALPAAGRRLRRLSRLHRPRDRPGRPGRRGPRRARQHADHLHRRRQRREPGGHGQRHAERVHHAERHPGAGEGPDALVSVLGLGAHLPALRRRLGLGDGHAVPVGEAGRLALRRHRPGPRHVLARPRQRPGRHPPAVPPRHRHHAHNPGGDRHPRAGHHRRDQAAPDGRREHGLHLGQGQRRTRPRRAPPSISR